MECGCVFGGFPRHEGAQIERAMSPLDISIRVQAVANDNARYGRLREMHSHVANMLELPGATELLDRAKRNIAKWEEAKTCSPVYARAWRGALRRNPADGVRKVIASKAARALMQNSPFGFMLRTM